jgi:predicted RNA-binding protein with PUA-like domain
MKDKTMMNYWLVKSEPEAYSWQSFSKDKETIWDGVRNYQARNNLNAMKLGDLVLFYHSGGERQVMGMAKVTKESFPDPTTEDERWTTVKLAYVEALKKPVTLAEVKGDARLQTIALVKQSRLSVMPLKKEEFDIILSLSEA